jgi:hypothetical protein
MANFLNLVGTRGGAHAGDVGSSWGKLRWRRKLLPLLRGFSLLPLHLLHLRSSGYFTSPYILRDISADSAALASDPTNFNLLSTLTDFSSSPIQPHIHVTRTTHYGQHQGCSRSWGILQVPKSFLTEIQTHFIFLKDLLRPCTSVRRS